MNYFIKGHGLKPDITFTNDRILVGKKEYQYDNITNIQTIATPTVVSAGTVNCICNGKIITLSFTKKESEIMDKAVTELQKIIYEKRKKENIELKTAEQMYEFSLKYGFKSMIKGSMGIKHFSIIADSLLPNEKVEYVFAGLHQYISSSKRGVVLAYAITNKRIIAAQAKIIGQNIVSIDWKNINDITLLLDSAIGIIIIDTFKETIRIGIDSALAKSVYTEIHNTLDTFKNPSQTVTETKSDPYEDLKKLKNLLDAGIVTQEEFDIKKKELLGI